MKEVDQLRQILAERRLKQQQQKQDNQKKQWCDVTLGGLGPDHVQVFWKHNLIGNQASVDILFDEISTSLKDSTAFVYGCQTF